jgi:phage-related protein
MATFDDTTVGTSTGGTTPDFGAIRKSEPNIRVAQFGDGYQQRVTFGLNQDPKVWDLRWTAKSNTDRAADAASFDWTPLNDTTTYKWVCRTWQRNHQYANINEITATFQQVFEP